MSNKHAHSIAKSDTSALDRRRILLGGTTMAGETEIAADRFRRATWVLSRRDGTWLIDAYTTCPA